MSGNAAYRAFGAADAARLRTSGIAEFGMFVSRCALITDGENV
jgi:hypothetical protein